jgi:hypothetical protein
MAADTITTTDLAAVVDALDATWAGRADVAALILSAMGPSRGTAAAMAVLGMVMDLIAEANEMDRLALLDLLREAFYTDPTITLHHGDCLDVTCDACDGRGVLDGCYPDRCPVCKGSGRKTQPGGAA